VRLSASPSPSNPLKLAPIPQGLFVSAVISGLPDFLLYFGLAVALVALYLFTYSLVTAHNEFALIRQNVLSAAVSLGLSLIGFALPLSSAIVHARSVADLIVWGLVALVVQIAVYWLVRLVVPNLSQRIASGELSSALFLGAASLAAGIVNAASMTY
jgi:putative membrane protein